MTSPEATPTPIELSGPDLTEEEIESVAAVLRTRHLSLGPKLGEFEQSVAECAGRRHGIAVNSGTSALHLVVKALGLGEGDEVITTPFSFVASSNCLLYERAVPQFVDIDPVTLNIDPARVEAAVTPRTKAILGVDVFGLPADWERLTEIAERRGLGLIEDSCEALGARLRMTDGDWRRAGSFGDAATFAFYPNKQITAGEGGMVVTDSDQVAEVCRSLRNQGREAAGEWARHARLGYNYRISDINCALGLAQMARLESILAARQQVANWYGELLSEVEGAAAPTEASVAERSWFVYVVRLESCADWGTLDRAMEGLRRRGIACSNYFYPIHLQPFYRERFGYAEGAFPAAERVSAQSVALPFHNRLTRDEVGRVVGALREVLAETGLDRPAS